MVLMDEVEELTQVWRELVLLFHGLRMFLGNRHRLICDLCYDARHKYRQVMRAKQKRREVETLIQKFNGLP